MKLLIGMVLSLGLSFGAMANDTLDKARWVQSLTGLFARTCSEFNTAVSVDVAMAKEKMSPHFTSLVMGYNLALKDTYDVMKYNSFIPNEKTIPYLDITALVEADPAILFDTVSVRCRMEPERAVIAIFSVWISEQQFSQHVENGELKE